MPKNAVWETKGNVPGLEAHQPLTVFDTSIAPKGDCYDLWRDHVAGVVASFDFNVDGVDAGKNFFGRMETLTLGPVSINRGDCSSGRWTRRSQDLPDGREHYAFYLVGEGSFRLTQGDVDSVCGPDHFALIDDGRPSDFYASSSTTDLGFVVSREAFLATQRSKSMDALPVVGMETASIRMLRRYVQSIFDSHEDFSDPVLAQKIGYHLLDLIALGLQPSRDAGEVATNRGLKAARLRSILAEIDQHFCASWIGPKTVAARVNISERYLHQLLEEQGMIFTHLVLERRLDKALHLLRDPRHDHLRIGQIAYESGFNDLSYFNRCFRSRFGDTPSGIRACKDA